MILSIDFDGTIVQNKFPAIGELMPSAKAVIEKLYKDGHYLIINTCREGDNLRDAVNFLLDNQIPFHRINDNEPTNIARYNSNSRKIYAHRYIDDKNIGGFPGWHQVYKEVTDAEREYQATVQTECIPSSDNKTKYQIYLYEGNLNMVDREVQRLQDEGWEIAGQISTLFNELGGNRMLVPLKRKIN